MTSFSPNAVGIVEMRSSTSSPSGDSVLMRPSCGRRFLDDLHPREQLDPRRHRDQHRLRDRVDLMQHAVDAEAHDARRRAAARCGCRRRAARTRTATASRRCGRRAGRWRRGGRACPARPAARSCARATSSPFVVLLRLLHRAGEVVELAQVALDVGRIGEDELDLALHHLLEVVRPRAHERLGWSPRSRVSAVDGDRQDAEALRVRVGHRRVTAPRSIFSGSMCRYGTLSLPASHSTSDSSVIILCGGLARLPAAAPQ